jgi:neutral ceramidase
MVGSQVRIVMIDPRSWTSILSSLDLINSELMVLEFGEEEAKELTGFAEIIEATMQALGPQATIAVPTCTPREGVPKPTFDPALSPSEMGSFSEFFRLQPGVLRSHNPTHSLAAFGRLAATLIEGHRSAFGRPSPWGDGSLGFGSPWDQLYQRNATWLMIGDLWDQSPLSAYIQAIFAQKHQNITRQTPFPRFNVSAIGRILREKKLAKRVTISGIEILSFTAQPAVDAILDVLENDPGLLDPELSFQTWLDDVAHIQHSGYLLAGIAKTKITPPLSCTRWEGRPFKGIARDLFARIVVFEYGGQRVALVLCDLLGISSSLVKRIRTQVASNGDFLPESIFIACTHSHSTPDTIGAGFENPAYIEDLISSVAKAIQAAGKNLQPVRLGWKRVPIRGLAHSRRIHTVNGQVFTTRYGVPSTWRVNPELIDHQGESDPDLTVIRIERLSGEVLAVISNFACHASVALMSHQISGDFPGEAMSILESIYGEGSIALCTNGAAADVDPTLEMPFWGPRDDTNARHLGRLFAAQVTECTERVQVEDRAVLGSSRQQLDLPLRADWIELLEKEQERMQQEFSAGWSFSPTIEAVLKEGLIQTEVHALRLNSLSLVGFPGEVLSSTGLKLKSGVPDQAVATVELVNDNIGYIPTQEAFEQGGYEVAPTLWGRVTPAAEEMLFAAAKQALFELGIIAK